MERWLVEAKAFEYSRHYSDCRKNNQRFIKARINRQNGGYLVILDMATCEYRLSKPQQDRIAQVYEKASFPNGHLEATSELCSFDGIVPDKLNSFLQEVYEISIMEPKTHDS